MLREVDFGSHWETQREPNDAFFAYSYSGLAVFKKTPISRCFEAHVILRFSENSKVLFQHTVVTVLLFLNLSARGVLGISQNLGVPEASFLRQLQRLRFSRVLEIIGNQRKANPQCHTASPKVLDLFN